MLLQFSSFGQPLSPHANGHVLIQFKAAATSDLAASGGADALSGLLLRLNLPAEARLQEPELNRVSRLRSGKIGLPASLERFLYLHLPPGLTVEQCIARLQRHPLIEYIEPDGQGSGGATIPTDPNFAMQWHHQNTTKPSASIHTPDAWDLTRGSNAILVAVLDTGCQTNLAEFSGRTVTGYNFVSNNANTTDDHGHGTAVAATLCANANNATGIAGVDWRCRLMPIKVLDQNNNGFYSWWAQAIDFAVANGCKVINLSAGGSSSDVTLTRAITNAIAHGVIFVTITHNDGTGVIRYPGTLPQSITVGATDEMDRRAGFSNYGPQIDLVAPGTNIATISRTGTLQKWWGTSFAAPQVAGVCALLAAVRPSLDQEQARALLCAGADDQVGGVTDVPGFDTFHGWGRLNAYNSLVLARTRIDDMRRTPNNTLVFSWTSPANGGDKRPYVMESAPAITGLWTPSTFTNHFGYGTNRTWFTNFNPIADAQFHRIRIRQD